MIRNNLKLEHWGPRKQWVLNDRANCECLKCLQVVEYGFYCPRTDKFWCKKCEKDSGGGRGVCDCTHGYHENFSVMCKKDDKNAKKH